jgi:hypothetical protein
MRIYFSIVSRRVPHEQGGELVALDWDKKAVLARVPMLATDPDVIDLNPRGGARGGRGILRRGDRLFAATYHTLHVFDPALRELGRISHPWFAGVHELCDGADGRSIVAACTSLDAAVEIDESGTTLGSFWPRENRVLAARFGLEPLAIDKSQDQRLASVAASGDRKEDPHHTHLNAVRVRDGALFVLLNRLGVVFDVTNDRIEIEDEAMIGSHNLVADGDRFLISDSRGKQVRVYRGGRLERVIELLRHEPIRAIHDAAAEKHPDTRVLFVRGLAVHDGRLFVGFSPATIAELDLGSGDLLGLHQHSTRIKDCVHGLLVWP